MINKTVLICDGGLFQPLVHLIADQFARVIYYRRWESSFPTKDELMIGTGYDMFEKVDSIWEVVNEVDIFIFPDIGFEEEQVYLKSIGKRVFGAMRGSEIEQCRAESKELFASIGLPVQPWRTIMGITSLREYLMEHDDVYVKVSRIRGIGETFGGMQYHLLKGTVDDIAAKLGVYSEQQEFVVEDAIPDAIEMGYDGYTISGQYPAKAIVGIEVKDAGYIGMVKPYEMLPKEVRFVNEKLAPTFKEYGYNSFWSDEIRIGKDKKPYLIDPTCRMASPAGECYLHLFENWGEIIDMGSNGILVNPKTTKRFAAQAILTCSDAEDHQVAIDIDPSIRKFVMLYHSAKIDGYEVVLPTDAKMIEIGSVVGVGNTVDEAINQCIKHCGMVHANKLKDRCDSLPDAKADLMKI